MTGPDKEGNRIACGCTILNLETATVQREGAEPERKLTRSELVLFQAFFRAPDVLLTKQDLMDALFSERANPPRPAIIRVFIHHLRRHLSSIESDLRIDTRRRLGWTLLVREPSAP